MSLINVDLMHPLCKEYKFKYAKLENIYDPDAPPVHCILVRSEEGGWSVAGNSGGPYEYETKKAAMEDLREIKKWQKGQGKAYDIA